MRYFEIIDNIVPYANYFMEMSHNCSEGYGSVEYLNNMCNRDPSISKFEQIIERLYSNNNYHKLHLDLANIKYYIFEERAWGDRTPISDGVYNIISAMNNIIDKKKKEYIIYRKTTLNAFSLEVPSDKTEYNNWKNKLNREFRQLYDNTDCSIVLLDCEIIMSHLEKLEKQQQKENLIMTINNAKHLTQDTIDEIENCEIAEAITILDTVFPDIVCDVVGIYS